MELLFFLKLAVALVPVQLLLALFALLDVFHLMRLREVLVLLLLGAIAALAAYPASWAMFELLPIDFETYSRWIAPVVEEALKCAMILPLFMVHRIGFKIDAAISGFAIGAGFSFVENLLYLQLFAATDFGFWLVRGLGTAVMHGGTAALFAAMSHQLTERDIRALPSEWRLEPLRFLPGLALAIAIHLGFNQLSEQPLTAMLLALLLIPLTLFAVFRYGAEESRAWLRADIEKHRAMLTSLHECGLGSLQGGSRLEALARGFRGRVPIELVQEYVDLHLQLVLRAEEALYEEISSGTLTVTPEDQLIVRRLAELKQHLGRTVVASLATLLPLTRYDLWEAAEFREHL